MVTLLFAQGSAAFAADNRMPDLSPEKAGSLELQIECLNEQNKMQPVSGMKLEICRVADLSVKNGSVEYTLTEPFASSGVSFEGMNADSSLKAAKLFAEIKSAGSITGSKAESNYVGHAYYSGLEPGMYLVVQTNADNKKIPTIAPYIVPVPLAVTEGENYWDYSVFSIPKPGVIPGETEPSTEPVEPVVDGETQTGDDFNQSFWLTICGLAALAALCIILIENRRRKNSF